MNYKEILKDRKKLIGACCGLIILLSIIGALTEPTNTETNNDITTDENLFNQSITIKTSQWDYNPDGFNMINSNVYGSCQGVDNNGVEKTYFFTDPQMAALGSISDYNFSFNKLHIISDNSSGYEIVTNIFYQDGSEVSYDWDTMDFKVYSKVAGANNPNCVNGFGYSTDELNNIE